LISRIVDLFLSDRKALSLDADQASGFTREQEKLLMERVGIILLLGCLLVPLFGLADYLIFPEKFYKFFTYRIIAAFCCLGLYGVNRRWQWGSRSFYLGLTGAYIVGGCIIVMILETGGYSTPYYAGLSLIFLGMCAVLPAKTALLVRHNLVLYLIYMTAVYFFSPPDQTGLFLVNNMFVISAVGIALLANRVDYRLRLKEFLVRYELDKARSQLEQYSKKLEGLFNESEYRYQLVVDNANEAIFVLQDGGMKFPNPKTLELFGRSQEELLNLPFRELVFGEDRGLLPFGDLEFPETRKIISDSTFRITRPVGDPLWVDMNAVSIEWMDRAAFLVFLRDVTEKKMMENELVHAQKMEAIGTLAGGMAHDFNNLLTGISGYTSLMLLRRDAADPSYERLKSIEQLVQSGANLTRQLLGFARGGKYEVKPTDLNELLRSSSEMFGRTNREIRIQRKYQKDLQPVEADKGQLEQVLLNLYLNAWQAMPEGGDLFLETQNTTLDPAYAARHSIHAGEYVRISVTDTGMGMDQATQRRIFEPFFTTKEMGRGTGLGLASVYGIIKNHGGLINVYSEVGKGTTFNIYLPVSKKAIADEETVNQAVVHSHETILLIDDEETILKVGKEMMEALGYRVYTALGGEEALKIYRDRQDKIDLAILDMVMPAMSGGETFDRLKAVNQSLKVILSSGFSMNDQISRILERGCDSFMQKPFNIKELSQKIREVLDRK
jgi:two-component system, cell cycle sensor histidine kinase and response regulator CckA